MTRIASIFAVAISLVASSACGGGPAASRTTTSESEVHQPNGAESHEQTQQTVQTDENGNVTRHSETDQQTSPPSPQ